MAEEMDNVLKQYARRGHPTVEELVSVQGLSFPRDPSELRGNFWPAEEPIDEFLNALHEWRGRKKADSGLPSGDV